jgi:hypothetical protein
MGDYGQVALQIVGTAVGSYFGAPQLGMVIGSLAGQALFPTKLPQLIGPRLHDSVQTMARIGQHIDEVHGTDVIAGNIIWMGPIREVATTEEVGGKGGPEQGQTTYTYYQSIAVGLCRGPMGGILRIWENGKLVYDIRARQSHESERGLPGFPSWLGRLAWMIDRQNDMVVYNGGPSQEPDPTIEADRGVGNVPAFRGLMYVVYPDRELKRENGYRHPNFKFEVTEYLTITSRPYPLNVVEYATSQGTVAREAPFIIFEEYTDSSGSLISGELREVLIAYEAWEPEFVETSSTLTSGTLRETLIDYSNWEVEFVETGGSLQSGTLRAALITYSNYPTEFVETSGSLVSGTLT